MSKENDFTDNFDKFIDVTDELPYWSAPFGIKLLKKVVIKTNITALDLGFGTGFPLIELAMRLGNTCKVYGIDPWQAAILRTKEKIKAYGINNTEIFRGKAENIPLENKSVDLITGNNALNNVENIKKSLTECYRILKPQGQAVFSLNLNETGKEFYDLFEMVLIKNDLHAEVKEIKTHIHKKRKPLSEIKNLITESGFNIIETEQGEFDYSFADGKSLFNHFFIKYAFVPDWRKIIPTDHSNTIFTEIEKEIDLITNKKGFFKLSVPFVVINCTK